MKFVDKQNGIASASHFVHHRLDPLFELASVLGTGNHHCKIQNHDSLVGQNLGHFAVDDTLREAFDNRSLANARLAQQNRVVLGSSAKNLRSAFNLTFATDNRVQLSLTSQFGQIPTEAVQSGCLALAGFSRLARLTAGSGPFTTAAFTHFGALHAVAQQIQDFLANVF